MMSASGIGRRRSSVARRKYMIPVLSCRIIAMTQSAPAPVEPPATEPRFFISYARGEPDTGLATELHTSLTGAGYDVFFDRKMKIGAKWADEIQRAIAHCDFLIVLLSADSARSEMVQEEVRLARERFREEGKPKFLPVRVKYSGPLGYALGAYLHNYEWKNWNEPADTEGVLREILDVARGRSQPPAENRASPDPLFGAAAPATCPPDPGVDLRCVLTPGGSLPPGDRFYIERPADREIAAAADRTGETVVIMAPRQMGKSSLLKRYLFE
jgi:hypothetical protein